MSTMPLPPRDPNSQPDPEFVQALNRALPFLWDGEGERFDVRGRDQEEFICLAVSAAAPEDTPASDVRHWQAVVEGRLQALGCCTFYSWARDHGVYDSPSIQAGRRAWMLDLVDEFSHRVEFKRPEGTEGGSCD